MKKPIGYLILAWLAKILAPILYQIEIVGKENIPKKGGCVLASNHQSYLDSTFIGGCVTNRFVHFIADQSTGKITVYGWLVRNAGVIFVNASKPTASEMKYLIRYTKELLDRGECILIYPEGSLGGHIREGQPGISLIHHGYPVVPILLSGNEKEKYRRSLWIFWPHKIKVRIGKPFHIDINEKNHRKNAALVMSAIASLA